MRFAVVGAGVVGRLRAEAVRGLSGAHLVVVADVDPGRAEEAAGGAAVVGDPRAAWERDDVDAVVVSTPAPLHEAHVVAALEAGKHVLCEKPLGTDPGACRRMVAAATRADRLLATGFNYRYFPSVRVLRELLREERLGALDHFRAFGGHDGLGNLHAEWMVRSELSGGGAMMDIGLHVTDLVRHLAGEIVSVQGVVSERIWREPGSEDNAVAVLRTDSGRPVIYQATWNEWRGYGFHVDAYGVRGMARAAYAPMFNEWIEQERPGETRSRFRRRYPWIAVREKLFGWQTTTRQTFAEELRDLARRLDGEDVPLATGEDGLRAVEVARALYRADSTGNAVTLTPFVVATASGARTPDRGEIE